MKPFEYFLSNHVIGKSCGKGEIDALQILNSPLLVANEE